MKYTPMLFLILFGCASTRKVFYHVESIPSGAPIQANGNLVCDSTPCQMWLQCTDEFSGIGRPRRQLTANYVVAATPFQQGQYGDEKMINPCEVEEGNTGKLLFNLHLRKISPLQKIEINK